MQELRRPSQNHAHSRLIYCGSGTQAQKFPDNRIHTAKYSLITFVPKFLFEQFRKYANVFFLIIVLLQQIDNVSPTGKYTTAVPFLIILIVSSAKEIFEDVKRHRADRGVNFAIAQVLNKDTGEYERKHWADVAVGDIIRCTGNSYFPADLLLLTTSEPGGLCYVETASLDGETNLKVRQALSATYELRNENELLMHLRYAQVDCEGPNGHLYEFAGSLKLDAQVHSITPNQILLRGAKLMNTKQAIGLVIYTGHESKLMLNSMKRAPLKQSALEKFTNRQMLFLLAILLTIAALSTLFSGIFNHSYKAWYLSEFNDLTTSTGFTFLTFLILYNNLIPISLQVSLEMVRFIQAMFINWDINMYCEETDTAAVARTSNLNEELGQVSYVLSDKTGTLTRNVMEFKQCSIAGVIYNEKNTKLISNVIQEKSSHWQSHLEFMKVLSVCHTVVPERIDQDDTDRALMTPSPIKISEKSKKIRYQAASPDEAALVAGAAEMGYEFTTRTPKEVIVNVRDTKMIFEILHVLEFDSTRKRMSVIIRDKTDEGKIKVYCKGADSVIYERLQKNSVFKEITLKHLEHFAQFGLRTLCLAYTELSDSEYKDWLINYQAALSVPIAQREAAIAASAEQVECSLQLLGATAIEDKLQEGVPEAIETLQKAGIKVWVLTGDKQETAINIGHSCRLLHGGQKLLLVSEETEVGVQNELTLCKSQQQQLFGEGSIFMHQISGNHEYSANLEMKAKNCANSDLESQSWNIPVNSTETRAPQCSLVIEGAALKHALKPQLSELFLNIALKCHSVICCRVSPKQKADIVQLVKNQTITGKREITLAIGDGANDVAMIRAAHVGIGISGREGLQAAYSADYSIAQFRFLVRLLLIHGSCSLTRLSKLILYSFYKNIALYVIELWFAIWSAWSGQTIFERWTIGMYNVLFTFAPPLAIGLLERPCEDQLLLRIPHLYGHLAQEQQSGPLFWKWVFDAIAHSLILFFMTFGAVQNDALWGNGLSDGGYLVFGTMLYTYVVVTVCIKAGLECRAWTIPMQACIWGSILSWLAFVLIYSRFWPTLPLASEMTGISGMIYGSWVFWIGLILIPACALLPDITYRAMQRTIAPTALDTLLWSKRRAGPGARRLPSDSDPNEILTTDLQDAMQNNPSSNSSERPRNSQTTLFSETARLLRSLCDGNGNSQGTETSTRRRPQVTIQSSGQPLRAAIYEPQSLDGTPLHFTAVEEDAIQSMRSGSRSSAAEEQLRAEVRFGYAFSQEEHGGVPQSQLIRSYDTSELDSRKSKKTKQP